MGGEKVDSPFAADEETRRHCFLSRSQRQQPHGRLKMSWAILKKYREKSNDHKESRALNFPWELLITNVDSIASWGPETLAKRQGELGSFDAQPAHDKQMRNSSETWRCCQCTLHTC